MPYQVTLDEQPVEADIGKRKPLLHLSVDKTSHTATEVHCPATGEFEITIDGHRYHGWCYTSESEVHVRINGRTHIIGMRQFGGGPAASGSSDNEVRADMPGTVVSLHAADGDHVTAGQKLMTIESMKLQIGIPAPRDGTIATIHFQANTTFDRGATLVTLVPLVKKKA